MSTTISSNDTHNISEQRKKLIQDIMCNNEEMLLLSNQIVATAGFCKEKEKIFPI